MMYYSLIILVFNIYIYIYIIIYINIGLDLSLVHSLYWTPSDDNMYLKMNMCHNFNTLDPSLTPNVKYYNIFIILIINKEEREVIAGHYFGW